MARSSVVLLVALSALVVSTLLAACTKGDAAPSSNAPAETKATTTQAANDTPSNAGGGGGGALGDAKAKEIFNTRCATCHGNEGRGNGPGAVTLNPKPRNYHDKDWQSKVTDEDIKKTITYGGAAVGKSPMMPASPDLDSKPEVVEGLLHIVREFGKS
jgi:mono/diheme cytochrome c family protein